MRRNRTRRKQEQVVGPGGRAWPWGYAQGLMCFFFSWSEPSPPPPPIVKKPVTQSKAKAAQEAEAKPAARKAEPADAPKPESRQRAEPSREIRNIIRMYQSRPGPVPVPVQPSRWASGVPRTTYTPGSHPVDLGPLPSLRKPSKMFLKKNNPKDEALAKLGISNTHVPMSVRPHPVQGAQGVASHLGSLGSLG